MLAALVFLTQLQGRTQAAGVPQKRAAGTLALTDRARSLAPEFNADLLLRLANSGLVTEAAWKRELIEEAFRSAARAQLPYLQWGDRSESLPQMEVRSNGFEALTLQTRAVEAMLGLDAARALELFDEIAPLTFPQLTCQQVITPDVSAYYKTAAKVFVRSFTEQQRKNEEDIHFLERRIRSMQSPAQVTPVLKLMAEVELSPPHRQLLTAAFAATLGRIEGGDRVFGTMEEGLVAAALPEVHETPLLVPALRAYIVRHLSGPRCSDHIAAVRPPASANEFNRLAARLDPAGLQFKPITAEEWKPLKDDGAYHSQPFWKSAHARQVLTAMQWLTHGNRCASDGACTPWTVEERSTNDWNAHYLDALQLIGAWTEDDEDSAGAWFCMVAQTYGSMASLAPPGRMRENAMANYLGFLEQQYGPIGQRNLWFTGFRFMLLTARFSKDEKDRDWMLGQMARSSNPVIALYSTIEKFLGPP